MQVLHNGINLPISSILWRMSCYFLAFSFSSFFLRLDSSFLASSRCARRMLLMNDATPFMSGRSFWSEVRHLKVKMNGQLSVGLFDKKMQKSQGCLNTKTMQIYAFRYESNLSFIYKKRMKSNNGSLTDQLLKLITLNIDLCLLARNEIQRSANNFNL